MLDLIVLGGLIVVAVFVLFMLLSGKDAEFMFGGKIVKTWDGVKGKRKLSTTNVKVHAVDVTSSTRLVGIELTLTTIGSYQMLPISLPKQEALELARLLTEAAEYRKRNKETDQPE